MSNPVFDLEAMRKKVQDQVVSILKRKKVTVVPEDVAEGVSLTTQLGIDSLDILQLTATIEKEYSVKIPEEELKNMDDIKGVLKALEKHWPRQ